LPLGSAARGAAAGCSPVHPAAAPRIGWLSRLQRVLQRHSRVPASPGQETAENLGCRVDYVTVAGVMAR